MRSSLSNDGLIRKPILAGSMEIDLHSAIFANDNHEYVCSPLLNSSYPQLMKEKESLRAQLQSIQSFHCHVGIAIL